ncbi:hypothetical protein [Geotalea uraniireducens]|nr:hypothetical protein [Geotalea uraniireducens]
MICFIILAGVILFWLIVYPAALLLGIARSILNGIRAGLKPTPTRR